MDRFQDDSGRNFGGDDLRLSCPTTDGSSDQDSGEQDDCEEEMTGVFCRCERPTRGSRLASVERNVLDILVSRSHLDPNGSLIKPLPLTSGPMTYPV